ncbi:nuclease-related domain-containing protein [Terrilactibacillus laevilacticus]|uniref:nuclease-related domain-containing protein n=1 Tax=Terrilactibacillus laevilacticus TaxID=1380157 RepID=UPI0011475F25|nr:nuclease-related domain-containing protein [Terrilactibacillus laevilacticus]
MIKKHRNIPPRMLGLESLLRRCRLNSFDRERAEKELINRKAGYKGEKSVDYTLSLLAEKKYFIFQDLRLPHGDSHFQMDTVLVSKSFILLMEVKNLAGIIYFEPEFDQMIRELDGKKEGYPNPLTQVKRHKYQVKHWLDRHKLPQLPIETLVVFSHPSTIIQASNLSPEQKKQITHSTNLFSKIGPMERRYINEILETKEMKKLADSFIKNHTPDLPNLIEQFHIQRNNILKGVHCPKCYSLPMKRDYGKWTCSACDFSSRQAHLDSLIDYLFLIGPTITNQQLRHFLQTPSRYLATDILTSLNVKRQGSTKGTTYQLLSLLEKKR